jgi:hypothetical protein
LALARLLSKTYEMCTAMHKDKSWLTACSRRPSNMPEEWRPPLWASVHHHHWTLSIIEQP